MLATDDTLEALRTNQRINLKLLAVVDDTVRAELGPGDTWRSITVPVMIGPRDPELR
jgi:hypothetical protein